MLKFRSKKPEPEKKIHVKFDEVPTQKASQLISSTSNQKTNQIMNEKKLKENKEKETNKNKDQEQKSNFITQNTIRQSKFTDSNETTRYDQKSRTF